MSDYVYDMESWRDRLGEQGTTLNEPPVRRVPNDSVAVEMVCGAALGAVMLAVWCWLHYLVTP